MHDSRHDHGFTMIELLITMTLGGIVMATAVWGMHAFLLSQRTSQTATSVRSQLRNAAEQSISEGRTYCVYFTATSYTVYKSACPPDAAAVKSNGPFAVADPSVTIVSPNFPPPPSAIPNEKTTCPTQGACAYFYPRGTALKGTVQVNRGTKTYTISVEGLTGRVSMV